MDQLFVVSGTNRHVGIVNELENEFPHRARSVNKWFRGGAFSRLRCEKRKTSWPSYLPSFAEDDVLKVSPVTLS